MNLASQCNLSREIQEQIKLLMENGGDPSSNLGGGMILFELGIPDSNSSDVHESSV